MSSRSDAEKKAMATEKNSEGREATRSILQDVCSDFETMNVVSTKTNKVGVIRNFRSRIPTPQISAQKRPIVNVQKVKNSASSTSVLKTSSDAANTEASNKTSAKNDTSSNRSVLLPEVVGRKSSAISNNVNVSEVQNKSELNKTVETPVASETVHLQPSTSSITTEIPQSAGLNTEPNIQIDSELLPLSSSQEASNVTIVPENFLVDNLSSLAQLADAEIIQSGDNVSIIVSNPRFIEVLTNSSTPISALESGAVIETPADVLETDIGQTQEIELVDSSLLTNNTLQNMMIEDDINLIQEEVASERSSSSKSSAQANTKSPKKDGRGRGRPSKSAITLRNSAESPPPSYIPSTPFSRGRRVTARMKAAWTKLLEMDGRLVCQMPGCSQKFVTVANFQTHFKYCSGKKTLVKCDYCDSMIFSTHRAILQHMEVEHPEKADEYRAAHQEEILEFEKNNAPDHLIIAEDENVAMNVEEVTQRSNISRKRKLSVRESTVPNKKVILKHKLQSIQNSMAENAEEFKKCVRFDSITDAIKSVKISSLEEACRISEVTPVRSKTDRRVKNVFEEKIVAADKYFEDDEDVDQPTADDELLKEKQELREKMHTKARLMLNLERYKRYQEYLTVTRDWSSERRTYSRPRGSDISAENSFNQQMINESFQDIHQLYNMTESSDISLNTPEAEINSIQMPPVETYQVVETPMFVSAVSIQPEPGEPDVLTSTPKDANSLNISPIDLDHQLIFGENRMKRETCYNRVNFETPKPKPKLGGIITYGINVPGENVNKSVEPPVTFDSLVNFMKPKTAIRNSQVEDIENILKPVKEEIVKFSNGKGVAASKKRGRPSKSKIDPAVNSKSVKSAQNIIKMQKGRAKKYSAAMLKTIERNVKNKKISKLFGIKKNMKSKKYDLKSKKYEIKSKKYASVQSKKNKIKNIRLKQLKSNLIAKETGAKKKKTIKAKKVDASAIQCQENIDNHLNVGQGISTSDITLHSNIISNCSYTSTLNQLIVDANIAGEIEIAASNAEQVLENIVDKSENLPETATNENASSEQISKKTESADITDLPETSLQVTEEKASQNEIESNIVNKIKLNDINKDQNEIHYSEKPSDSVELIQNDKDGSTNLMQKDTESNDPCLKPMEKDFENDACIKSIEKDVEGNDTSIKSVEKDLESNKSVDLSSVQDNQLESTSSDKQPIYLEDAVKEQLNKDNVNDLTTNIIENLPETHKVPPSDTNKEADDMPPEVPVKRGRGRPRKNSKKIVPRVSKVKSLQQSAMVDHESDGSKVIDDNAKVCDEVRDNSAISETSILDNSASVDNNTVSVVRKSERVRRRKLVDDETSQTPIIETKQNETTPITPVPESTPQNKRRGRPRKSQIQESPQVTPDNKIEDSNAVELEVVESEANDDSLRKFSRKGRPRKCVRYADLNSGLESSESMDGTHSAASLGKDKSDSTQEKSAKSSRKSEEVNELSTDSKEQEENIVLPLKKRKQRQSKKNDSEMEKSKSSNIVEEEILLSDEQSQNKPEENEDASEKRTMRGRKRGTKRKKAVNSSDEEWDPEVHLKSIGKSTSHKSLLELEETSDSSSSEKRDPTFSKKEVDFIRRIATRHIKTKRLDVSAAKYSLKTSENLFMEYKPQSWMWKILSGDDYILPPMKISPYFKIEKAWEKTETYWSTLNLFDSVPLDSDSCHGTFFTGGPVTCSAWCPTPVEKNKVQYVALAVNNLMNKLHSYVCEEPEGGFLQLWNLGDLNKRMLQRKPFMEMSIFHQYGPINDMAWCPYGCWENPEVENSSDVLPRLGLLAVACSDSNVRIYSIPHPHLLPKRETSYPIYLAHPSVVLESLYADMCLSTKKSVCVSLSWQRSDHCERIAAGYGCGMICIWHVNSSATVLASKENNQIVMKPYLIFNAHGTPVLGLSFSPLPSGRYLVSASVDKTLKFWDLIDTSLPVYTMKKGAGKCAHWSSYYCGAFGSIQHGMNNYKGSSFFKECGTETISSRALSHPNCFIILSSMSDWLNALAIGDIVGNVSVSFTHSLIHEHSKGLQYFQRFVYESELKPVEGIVEKIIFSSYPESVHCIEKITEVKQTSLLLDEIVSLVCRMTDIVDNSVRQKLENLSLESSQMTLKDVNDVVSVVHQIVENCEPVVLDIEEVPTADAQDFMQECNGDYDNEEVKSDVPRKLSSITDIVTLVTDINDVTEAVDQLICSSEETVSQVMLSSQTDMTSDTSLVEVDNSEDLHEIHEQSDDAIQSSLEIILLLDSLINAVCQNEETQKKKELSDRSEQETSENVVTDIHSESIACISAADEMTDIVAVVESMTERFLKLLASNVSPQTVQSEDMACVSAVEEMSNVITVMESLAENCSKSELTSCENECEKDKKHVCNRIGLPHDLSEIVDVVSTVSDIQDATDTLLSMKDAVEVVLAMKDATEAIFDMKDTTEVLSAMKDTTEVVCELKAITETVSDMKDVVSSSDDLKDIISSTEDLKDVTVITEKLENDAADSRSSDCAIASLVSEIVENVSNEQDSESEATRVMNNLISNIQMAIKSINYEEEKSCQILTGDNITAKEKSVLVTDVIEIKENVVECDNSLPKNFDYQLHELADEMDEQMLSADSESSNSDNDTDDDMEVDDSYMFDQDSNLSDDSILSERSLDSAASIYSFSSESDMSVDSEQETDDLASSNHNVTDTVNISSRLPPKLTDLTFDGKIVSSSQNLNVENNYDAQTANISDNTKPDNSEGSIDSSKPSDSSGDLTANVSGDLTANVSDSTILSDSPECPTDSTKPSDISEGPSDFAKPYSFEGPSDCTKPSNSFEGPSDSTKPSDSSGGPIDSTKPSDSYEGPKDSAKPSDGSEEGLAANVLGSTKSSKDYNVEAPIQENDLSVVIDSNVPNSENLVLSEDKPSSETVDETLNSSASEVELVLLNNEIITQISDQVEPITAISSNATSMDSANKPGSLNTSNALSEMPCDSSICIADAAEISVYSSNETCVEITDKTVNGTDVESLPTNFNSAVLPETVESISKSNEIVELDVLDSEQSINHKSNYASTQVESSTINKKKNSETFSSYEDVISQYGIVFKDMNTAKFDQIEQESYKELGDYSFNRFNLTAIKTVSWNPNRGSHHWLLSAGQSGIARLSYISDMLQQASSDRKAK